MITGMKTPALVLATLLALVPALAAGPADAPTQPRDNLDYWLTQAGPASQPTSARGANPFAARTAENFSRPDALPGAMQLSDGKVLAGGLYTTQEKDLEVWIQAQQRWRHIPLLAVLGIRAVVVSEELEPEWRWKQMGSDEKVFTGRARPSRQLNWRVNLIDGTSLEGEIKGQPLWIERAGQRTLYVLHSRAKGEFGQTLNELVYPRHVVISGKVKHF